MISFTDMIGKEIAAVVPLFHQTQLQRLRLVNVEAGGLWVENRKISDTMLKSMGVTASPKSVIFFLPFHQISFSLAALDEPYISDEAMK